MIPQLPLRHLRYDGAALIPRYSRKSSQHLWLGPPSVFNNNIKILLFLLPNYIHPISITSTAILHLHLFHHYHRHLFGSYSFVAAARRGSILHFPMIHNNNHRRKMTSIKENNDQITNGKSYSHLLPPPITT